MGEQDKDALVPVESAELDRLLSGQPDLFERDYMKGEGRVLARHRMVAGRTFNIFLGVTAAAVAIPIAVAGQFLAGGITLASLGALWVFFGVLRVTISERAVNVKYGVFGPKIPVESIVSAEAVKYTLLDTGGWGIRWKGDGWMYNMMGDGGNAVRIVWRARGGGEKVTYVGMTDSEKLVQDIRSAARVGRPAEALAGGRDETPALGSTDESA
jgi:hypothetical protein